MIKTLAKCVRENKKNAILTPILVSLEVVMEVLIPLIMAALIDKGINANSMDNIIKYGLLLLLCAVLSFCFGAGAGITAARASCGFAKNLRQDMFYNIQKFSFSNIDKFSSASLVTRLTTDVTNVQMAFQMLTRMAFRSPIMLVFALISSFNISVKLSLIFVAVLPFLGFGLFFLISKVHPIFTRVFKTYDKLNAIVEENINGVRVVKSFNREKFEEDKFNSISDEIYQDFTKAEKLLAFNHPLMMTSMFVCMLMISWFGAQMIVNSNQTVLTVGELTSFISYTMQILMGLMMISVLFVFMTLSRASGQRICEVLNEKTDLDNPENPITEVKDGSITFDNVSFYYGKNPEMLVLDNINLNIASGETVGILGTTGSSKSSLISLIPRLYDVVSGSVSVGGVDVRKYDLTVLRDSVSVVLQKNILFSGTINENLRWGNENATDEEIKEACRLAQADSFIESFPDKYETVIDQGGTNVSGGQKQRLCIARSLLKKPKILILDDSTSAVDTKTDALIRAAFKSYIPETTKIIIAQRVASVMEADKIVIIDNGKIINIGNHDQLMANEPIYREIYDSQMKGDEE